MSRPNGDVATAALSRSWTGAGRSRVANAIAWARCLAATRSRLPGVPRFAATVFASVAAGGLLAGCGASATGGAGRVPLSTPAAAPVAAGGTCADYSTWRDAQDAFEAKPDESADLDSDGDGVACSAVLGQPEYEEAWSEAYPEGCAGVFGDSSTGALYGDDGTEFTSADCERADPGPGDWDADALSEPADDGHRDGWQAACDETFGPSGASGDLQLEGEGIQIGQIDCENRSPY